MALTTPNMGLISWDLLSDPYDHNQLAANFNTLDSHDHTPGKGLRITTPAIQNEAVTNPKLGNWSVSTLKVEDDAITARQMDRDYVHPVGSIMPWWRPNASTGVPAGWEICMGQTILEGDHDFEGGGTVVLPDLRNQFLLGADVENTGTGATEKPAIGYQGGNHLRDITHQHTIPSHTHTVPGHSHTVNSHSHSIPGHSHTLSSHRHVHFHTVVNQYRSSTSGEPAERDFPPRAQNNVLIDGTPIPGPFTFPRYADIYSSGSVDTYTRYAGNVTGQFSMMNLYDTPGRSDYRVNTTYMRYITFSSPPVDGNGKSVTQTGSTSGESGSSSPGTNSVNLTTDGTTLTTNPAGGVLDFRPNFVGVLYLMKVKNTMEPVSG